MRTKAYVSIPLSRDSAIELTLVRVRRGIVDGDGVGMGLEEVLDPLVVMRLLLLLLILLVGLTAVGLESAILSKVRVRSRVLHWRRTG